MVAVLLAGAVITAEVASRSGDDPRPCHTDVRCSGQSATTATGPLAPPESWSAVLAAALSIPVTGTGSAIEALHAPPQVRVAAVSTVLEPPTMGKLDV